MSKRIYAKSLQLLHRVDALCELEQLCIQLEQEEADMSERCYICGRELVLNNSLTFTSCPLRCQELSVNIDYLDLDLDIKDLLVAFSTLREEFDSMQQTLKKLGRKNNGHERF